MPTPPSKPFGRSLNDFGELLPAETRLRDAVRLGEPAVIGTERPSECTPENEIRAGFLRFLALGGDEYAPVHEQGVEVAGAWISGLFDVTGCDIPGNFIVFKSFFEKRPVLQDAYFHSSLNLEGSQLPGLSADRMTVNGSVFLRKEFSSTHEVRLVGVRIGGALSCREGCFNSENNGPNSTPSRALSLDKANIQGNVFLDQGFLARGEVRLQGASIGGALRCTNGFFRNPDGTALLADSAKIEGDILLNPWFLAQEATSLPEEPTKEKATKNSGNRKNKNKKALSAKGIHIAGRFVFKNIPEPVDGINLSEAEVGVLVDDEKSWGNELVLDGFVYHSLGDEAPCDASTRIAWLKKQQTDHCNNPNGFKPQPWQQLIATLRAMGHKTAANQIAIEREKHLRKIGKVGETPPEWGAWKTTLYRVVSLPLHWLFGTLMAYGYRPIKLAAWMILVWLVSGGLFWCAALSGVFAPSNPLVFDHPKYQHCSPTDAPASPTKENPTLVHCFTEMQSNSLQALTCQCSKSLNCLTESSPPKEKFGNWYLCPELASEYTGFSPLAYSLDLLLPLVDLQQEHDWAPYIPTPKATWHEELLQFLDPTDWKYHWTRVLVWFEILFGWVASLLLVAVVSGLTNRDKDD